MTSRQDKTRSPAPNELARLYEWEKYLEDAIAFDLASLKDFRATLREVRAAIKRANGDSGAKI